MINRIRELLLKSLGVDESGSKTLERQIERLQAIVDVFVLEKSYDQSSNAGLNGQEVRKGIVRDICSVYRPDVVIETGTFFGLTSGYFASQLQVPVYTCEINPTYFKVAAYLLRNVKGVHQHLMDSRQFLRHIATMPDFKARRPLIYLDAHWDEDLPLREELQIVFSSFESPCVLVDDFKVPSDSGYEYDDYGKAGALSLELVSDLVKHYGLVVFFPRVAAKLETGGKRGWAVIARKELGEVLTGLTDLVRYKAT